MTEHQDPPAPGDRPAAQEPGREPLSTATSPLGVPDSLTIRSEAAAAVGAELLASGMASYRVRSAMSRTARALGLDSFSSVVSYTDITATATLDGRYRTRLTQPQHVGVDVDRLYRTQRYVETLPPGGVTPAEVFEQLAAIRSRRPLHPRPLNAAAAGFACAAFAVLNQGGPVEALAAGLAAGLGQAARRTLQLRGWNHLLITVIAAVVAAGAYLLAIGVPTAAGWLGPGHLGGYLAAVLFLVPGFPLITGMLDLVRADYSAGLARLTYAALIIISAAASVWTVSLAVGIEPVPAAPLGLDPVAELLLRAAATFVGVLGFALLFNSPWPIGLAAAGVALVANSLRFLLTEGGVPVQLATLAATVLVGLLAYLIARTRHVPRTSISVPAVVIMIPGYAMYGGFTLLNAGELFSSVMMLQQAVQTVFAAAFGLALAHLATSSSWRRVEQPR
ncbi:threonine/serine ThrE exporter family protein [Brachybacterium sp. UNK5269]|uniref:threonine/serine ThrE exporter family protein n=1 Tax=Brachybacterium sp. UNK5269 TaxID=3408576 RepID=UPI003BAE9412